MIVDGLKFNKCHTVIALPLRDANGDLMPYVQEGKENYTYFGQIVVVADGTEPDAHLINTGATYEDGKPVYAKVIPNGGWSLTNMMYAKGAYNGYVYLAKDGKYFRAKIRKAAVADVATVVAETDGTPEDAPEAPSDTPVATPPVETVNLSALV